jgi:outer membrane protein W
MKNIVRGVLAAVAIGAATVSGYAADLASRKAPPVVVDDGFNPFQIRLLASGVLPLDGTASITDGRYAGSSGLPGLTPWNLNTNGFPPSFTPLAATGWSFGPGTSFAGANTTISWAVVPTVTVDYFFNKNWSVELICCFTPHKVQGMGSIYGANVIDTLVFPPSLTIDYHFTNFGAFQPYLGVGVNFTAFLTTKGGQTPYQLATPFVSGAVNGLAGGAQPTYVSATSASITPSWGVVGQAGFDYMLTENWGVNFDVKYIMMEPNAHVYLTGATNYGKALANTSGVPVGQYGPFSQNLDLAVKINPLVVSTGLTYRFGKSVAQPALAKTVGSLLPSF